MLQEEYVGLDVSQVLTHICVVNRDGKIIWQGKCESNPDAIAETLIKRSPHAKKIGFESGPLSPWLWHTLKEKGFPLVCLDAKHAQAALSMQLNKTDKNDAHGLAQVVRTGWYKEVSVKSYDSHAMRALLGARAQLVDMRTEIINQIKGYLKLCGIIVRGKGAPFEQKVEEAIAEGKYGHLDITLQTLLSVYRHLRVQISIMDKQTQDYAKENTACRNLMTIPGVGVMTAVSFVSTVDNPHKFSRSKQVGAYFGLTPRRYQSGDIDRNTQISKCGDSLARSYLFEAASILLLRITHKRTNTKT